MVMKFMILSAHYSEAHISSKKNAFKAIVTLTAILVRHVIGALKAEKFV